MSEPAISTHKIRALGVASGISSGYERLAIRISMGDRQNGATEWADMAVEVTLPTESMVENYTAISIT
jgi:hypothetical protein